MGDQQKMQIGSFSDHMIDSMAHNVNLGGPDMDNTAAPKKKSSANDYEEGPEDNQFGQQIGSINSVNDMLLDDIVHEMETPQYGTTTTNDYAQNVDTATDESNEYDDDDDDDDVLLGDVNTLGQQFDNEDMDEIIDDETDTNGFIDNGVVEDDEDMTIGDYDDYDNDDEVLHDINAKVTIGGDDMQTMQ